MTIAPLRFEKRSLARFSQENYADVLGCFPSTDHGMASVATKAMPAKTTRNTRLTKVIMAMDR
jgi:hypothetical protein